MPGHHRPIRAVAERGMAADQRQELLLHRQPEIAVTGQLNPAALVVDRVDQQVDRRRQSPLAGQGGQRRPHRHALGPELAVEQDRQRPRLRVDSLAGGVDPDPAMVAQTRAAPLKATSGRMRCIKLVPAGLRRRLRHLQSRDPMAASTPPAVRVQRIGYRPRQQFAPAFAQQRAVRLISAEHLRGKIIVTVGGNKAVAAAPGRRQRGSPAPGVGPGQTLQRLRPRILMVVGHAGDIEPYPTARRTRFIPCRIPPPERHLDGVIHRPGLRTLQGSPPLLASCR